MQLAPEDQGNGEFKWRPNTIAKKTKDLPFSMAIPGGRHLMEELFAFEFDIEQLVAGCIVAQKWGQLPQVPESSFNEDQLVRLAGEPVNGGTWSESLSNIKKRPAAIKCFLAQYLFRRMDPLCNVEENLLPPEIATLYQQLYKIAGPLEHNPHRGKRAGM